MYWLGSDGHLRRKLCRAPRQRVRPEWRSDKLRRRCSNEKRGGFEGGRLLDATSRLAGDLKVGKWANSRLIQRADQKVMLYAYISLAATGAGRSKSVRNTNNWCGGYGINYKADSLLLEAAIRGLALWIVVGGDDS